MEINYTMTTKEIAHLYSKPLLVKLKNEENQERVFRFVITIEIHSVSVIKKELLVRLTEENNGFLLYTLLLTEDDFLSLKTEQGLLVDFHAFPQKFIDLLECCHREEAQKMPKFVLRFLPAEHSFHNEGILEIIETNSFKHLIHLSLTFQQGTDADVKNYLLSCLKSLQESKTNLENQFKAAERTLNCHLAEMQEQLNSRTVEIQRLKSEWKEERTDLNNHYVREISKERERALQVQNDLHLKYEMEKREAENAWKRQIEQLEDKLRSLHTENKELVRKNQELENLNCNLKSHLSIAGDDIKYKTQEIERLNHETKSLSNQLQEQETLVHNLKTRLAVLDQELKNMEDLKANQVTLIATIREQKQSLEALFEEKQQQLQKQEASNRKQAQELKKAQCFISNLQTELRKNLSKLKLSSETTEEQDKRLTKKEQELRWLQQEFSAVKENLMQKENELKTLQSELEKNKERVVENERLTQEVKWLQNQLTKKELSENKGFTRLGGAKGIFHVNEENLRTAVGFPIASSTPQMFGYFGAKIPPKNLVGDEVNVNTKDKENEAPLDPKYLQPSGIPLPKKPIGCHGNGVPQQKPQGKRNLGTTQMSNQRGPRGCFNSIQMLEGKRQQGGSSAYFPDKSE